MTSQKELSEHFTYFQMEKTETSLYILCIPATGFLMILDFLEPIHVDKQPLKHQTNIAADDVLILYFYLSKKIRLDVSSESSA